MSKLMNIQYLNVARTPLEDLEWIFNLPASGQYKIVSDLARSRSSSLSIKIGDKSR